MNTLTLHDVDDSASQSTSKYRDRSYHYVNSISLNVFSLATD